MTERQYHHKNLRNELIEKGIELVNKEGEEYFSLRKVAMVCGVSHAAPYSHFKSKEKLLNAMQDHIMEQFSDLLENTIRFHPNNSDLLTHLAKAYVMFFYRNPQYYPFLFSRQNIETNFSLDTNKTCNNRPFELFKFTAVKILKDYGLPEQKIKDRIIAMWALVHGLAAIATMKTIHYDEDWEIKIEDIINSLSN